MPGLGGMDVDYIGAARRLTPTIQGPDGYASIPEPHGSPGLAVYDKSKGSTRPSHSQESGFYSAPNKEPFYLSSAERSYVNDFFEKYPHFYAKGDTPDINGLAREDRKDRRFIDLFMQGRLIKPSDPASEGSGRGGMRSNGYDDMIAKGLDAMGNPAIDTAGEGSDTKKQRRTPLISTGEEGILEQAEVGTIGLLGD